MFKFDHFIINVDKYYQKDKDIIDKIITAGFPYKPSWEKGLEDSRLLTYGLEMNTLK
ncbi:MAG: hypothetical protein KIA08_09655 [Clostridium baratii]|uniref:hypothetical protein n=1 Tax=Clostridium baratii TaxID=1561 RepID=UPI00243322A0|nr:hypothetical protein [Clostridium baratii]MBS6042944.1 hypothetical protein [Clostridium baratii]